MDKFMDKNLVKKVMTFKSGKFAFSRRYDQVAIDKLLIEAKTLREAVEDLPVLPAIASQLEEETIRRSIFSTAALEGNPLNEEQVAGIVNTEQRRAYQQDAEKEISNLKLAYRSCQAFEIKGEVFLLSEKLTKDLHQTITQGLTNPTNTPGVYREHIVKVGNREHGGVYTPPKIRPDIEKLMKELVAWLNSAELLAEEPLVRAGLAHFHFATIHPFADGNGRTARLLESVFLRADGIRYVPAMLSNFYYQHMDDYYWAFSLSQRNKTNDLTPFLEFMLRAFIASLHEIKERLSGVIRQLAMESYITFLRGQKTITQRQSDLLQIMLETKDTFSLQDLFNKPIFSALYRHVSERTARRDIAKLTDMNLILPHGRGRYRINLHRLDRLSP